MKKNNALVLVGVVRRRKDLDIALKRHWYRIPAEFLPKRRPAYLALYETRAIGTRGRAINYYASIRDRSLVKRLKLLPEEKGHPRAKGLYCKFELSLPKRLPHRIENRSRRRVTFGFTSLKRLLRAKEVSELFEVIPLEDMMRRYMSRRGVKALHEYCLMEKGRLHYRLDFAIFCRKGKIAIECDNRKWHGQPRVQKMDRKRDQWLRSRGWEVLHFSEKEIMENPSNSLKSIKHTIRLLGGVLPDA